MAPNQPPFPPGGSGRPPGRSASEPSPELLDLLDGEIPEVDDAPSAAEKARAASFAELIDKAIAGRTPPALSADERALLEVTTVIRAAAGHGELATPPRRAAVESAIKDAIEHALASALGQALPEGARSPSAAMDTVGPVQPFGPRAGQSRAASPPGRAARRSWVPWMIAGATTTLAAAAMATLWLRAPRPVAVSAPAPVPIHWRSRPADALIGEIQREAAGDAAARLDSIYSDRLDGFREATLFRPRSGRER